jgi:hypothetical protein
VQPVVDVVHVLGKRQYIAATGPSIPAGAGGGFTLSVNGETGSIWPQVRVNATMGTVRGARWAAVAARWTAALRPSGLTVTDRRAGRSQNITVTLSGAIPFSGAVLTSYQFTDRPGANLWTTTGPATAYDCATQVGTLRSVTPGNWTVRAH